MPNKIWMCACGGRAVWGGGDGVGEGQQLVGTVGTECLAVRVGSSDFRRKMPFSEQQFSCTHHQAHPPHRR